jgi:hypothetical protein|tara:strand:+ start:6490 stop:11154 length:4665 start_codon:yes stop_codon:yes gene_type:complete
MSFNTFSSNRNLRPLTYDEERVNELIESSKYKQPWHSKAASTLGRVPLRFMDDFRNTAHDLTGGVVKKAEFDSESIVFGEDSEQGFGSNLVTELGTFAVGFGVLSVLAKTSKVKKGLDLINKSKPAVKAQTAFKSTVDGLVKSGRISTNTARRTALISKIASDGMVKGAMVDFFIADVKDEDTILERIAHRAHDVYIGAALGAGINIGLRRFKQFRRKRRAKKLNKTEERGSLESTVDKFTSTLKEVKTLAKDAFDEDGNIRPEKAEEIAVKLHDELVENVSEDLASVSKDVNFEIAQQTNVIKVREDYGAKINETLDKVKGKSSEEAKEAINDDLIDNFIKSKDLPSLLLKLNLDVETANFGLMKHVADLSTRIKSLGRSPSTKAVEYTEIENIIKELEVDLLYFRSATILRAKAGTMAGKTLQALRLTGRKYARKDLEKIRKEGKTLLKNTNKQSILDDLNKGNFNRDVNFSEEVADRLDKIDSLLEFIGKRKDVNDPEYLKSFVGDLEGDALLKAVEEVDSGKALPRIMKNVVKALGMKSKKTLWDKYEDSIVRNLKAKYGKQKLVKRRVPVLQALSRTLEKRLQGAIEQAKEAKKSTKQKAKEKALKDEQNLQRSINELNDLANLAKNPAKIEDLIRRLQRSKIISQEEFNSYFSSKLDNLASVIIKEQRYDILARLDLEPNLKRDLEELVESQKAKIANSKLVSKVLKEEEMESEINAIRDVLLSGDDNAIVEFFEARLKDKKKITPLQEELRNAKRDLSNKVRNIKNKEELIESLFNKLNDLNSRTTGEIPTRWTKFKVASDRFRQSMMLFRPDIILSGVVSGMIHMIDQPIRRAIRALFYIKGSKKEGINSNLDNVDELQYAMAEIKTMVNFSSFWDAVKNGLSSFKRGRSAFNPRLRSRYQQDVYNLAKDEGITDIEDIVGIDVMTKMTPDQANRLSQIVKLYGTDNQRGRILLNNFIDEVDRLDDAGALAKFFDLFTSISFRAMGTVDDVYRTMGTMRALRSEALQKAIEQGIKGNELEKFLKEYVEKATSREIVSSKEAFGFGGDKKVSMLKWNMLEEFEEVEQLGLSITYQADYADQVFSKMIEKAAKYSRDYKNDSIGKWLVRTFVLPYAKTPAAIGQWMVNNFPSSGFIQKYLTKVEYDKAIDELKIKRDKATGLRQQQLDSEIKILRDKKVKAEADRMADGILGFTWTFALFGAAASSRITGNGNHMTEAEKIRAMQAGWKPNVIRIGGIEMSYDRFEPIVSFLSIASDTFAFWRREEQYEDAGFTDELKKDLVMTTMAGFMEMINNKAFLRPIGDLFSAYDEAGRVEKGKLAKGINRVIAGYVGSYSPAFVKDLQDILDPYAKRVEGIQNQLKERTFGGSSSGYYRNIFGEKEIAKRARTGFVEWFSPAYISKRKEDFTLEVLSGMNTDFGMKGRYNRTIGKEMFDTRKYRNDKGQDLFDAWLGHLEKYKIGNKTIRKSITDAIKLYGLKEGKVRGGLPVNSESGDSITVRLGKIINDYEKRSFEDFIRKNGNKFKDKNGNDLSDPKFSPKLESIIPLK